MYLVIRFLFFFQMPLILKRALRPRIFVWWNGKCRYGIRNTHTITINHGFVLLFSLLNSFHYLVFFWVIVTDLDRMPDIAPRLREKLKVVGKVCQVLVLTYKNHTIEMTAANLQWYESLVFYRTHMTGRKLRPIDHHDWWNGVECNWARRFSRGTVRN